MDIVKFFKLVCSRKHKTVVTQINLTTGVAWNREQFSYNEIDQIAEKILTWDRDPSASMYFSVGGFDDNVEVVDGKNKIRRTKEKAASFRVLAFDLDVGPDKQFPDRESAIKKLSQIIKALGLPKPMVIGSGIGAHVYFILSTDIEVALWIKASTALSNALAAHGLEIDKSKIFDPSMVLRPVGTFHKKQDPWLPVCDLVTNETQHDIAMLIGKLKDYLPAPTVERAKVTSSIATAILGEDKNDLNLDSIAESCEQIRALLESGGAVAAGGHPVEEPLWRLSLGMAKYTPDPEESIIRLAGQHPEFDLKTNLDKLSGWKGTGPSTCAKFEELNPDGCHNCPYRGAKTSPAQLSGSKTKEVQEVNEAGEIKPFVITMPDNYVIRGDAIYQEEVTYDDDGTAHKDWIMVSPYIIYVKAVFYNHDDGKSAVTIAVKYPLRGWVESDQEAVIFSSASQRFAEFLADAQLWTFKSQGQKEKLRGYLMDYLTMVQQRTVTGYDYSSFGWQKDGSFLCGETIINPPSNSPDRRIVGDAKKLLNEMYMTGTREEYIKGLQLLNDLPGSMIVQACLLMGCTGILAKQMGNGSSIISIYSPETTTGKSFILMAINAMAGHPKELMQGSGDSRNSIFKTRGTFNNVAMVIDEITLADPEYAASLAYSFSEGREKKTLTANRDTRDPARWDGPTFLTTNSSLIKKYELSSQSTEPLRVRTMELNLHERTMVNAKDKNGVSIAEQIGDYMFNNHGHALPEIAQLVIDNGGPAEVVKKGKSAFRNKFKFDFLPQERFYESFICSAWILGRLGKSSGIFPIDVDACIHYLYENVVRLRNEAVASRQDAVDIVGQFLQENNEYIIEVNEEYGQNSKPQVRSPQPVSAVVRMHCIYDAKNPILPGSTLSINLSAFRKFLKSHNTPEDMVIRELSTMGILLKTNERVTMFKGCSGRNPGQAVCFVLNLNHPRFLNAVAGSEHKKQSTITLALLDGLQEA